MNEIKIYRRADVADIPQLIKYRMELLHSTIKDCKPDEWSVVEKNVELYYKENLPIELHIAYLAYDGRKCVGTGGICYYQVMPTYYKPTGKKAFITNMYTEPQYRGQGIATTILDYLVTDSLKRGITFITLEATEMGRPVYERYGFAPRGLDMQLVNETYEG